MSDRPVKNNDILHDMMTPQELTWHVLNFGQPRTTIVQRARVYNGEVVRVYVITDKSDNMIP